MNLPRYTTVLFDLDGTLTDPFEGISRSINYALERLGRPAIPLEILRTWIGPSLRDSFASVLDEDRGLVEQAVALYRERYGPIGSTENRIYPGIPELLGDLSAAGCAVCLATSKPQIFARHILEHFGLEQHFSVIGGASLDTSRERKADVIAYVLDQLPPQRRERVVMVGDREHDVAGATEHGIPAIGVSWGYGSAEELSVAGAVAVVERVVDLRPLLGV
ncbi:HAD family hydrolase [Candidatus Oscillochloris fontis]|uniref:HAD family hydrolase n=1 Tax=Candidatus Oscillochloris fontis TaxID=2496868 RepID=UPI00101DC0CD|nr:HAD family hydrolase [Candidatus Oscillochloris fontis]